MREFIRSRIYFRKHAQRRNKQLAWVISNQKD